MAKNKFSLKVLLWFTLVTALLVGSFYWNEARKEVVFLCGNFVKGTSEQSVLRQLNTGNLLRYHFGNHPSGNRIIVDSPYNLSMYKCIIDFDGDGKVIESRLE